MRNKKAFITESTKLFKKVMCFTVLAEEVKTEVKTEDVQEPQKAPTVNFEDLIANARKQEKDKLYPQIKKLEEEKATLTEKSNAHLLTIGEKDAEISTLKKEIEGLKTSSAKGVSDKENTLLAEIETLKKNIADLETGTITREELENEIRSEYEVKLYREQKLREVGDSIIPELVTGTTKEEIDASIQVSQTRFNQITERVIGSVNVQVPNPSVSSFQTKDLKIEDIANIDPRSPEYAQLRAKLGLK